MKKIIIALVIFALAFGRPCCPEDPEDMTFYFIRNNPDYLIGNHIGDCFSPPFNWWFWDAKINGYSMDGKFVMGMETENGCVVGYSREPYGHPTLTIKAKEDAVNRVWHAYHMPSAFFREIFFGNIKFYFHYKH